MLVVFVLLNNMSNDLKLTQEKWNLILDLKEMVNNHSQTINKMAKLINSQQEKIKELENELKTKQTTSMFQDFPFGMKK